MNTIWATGSVGNQLIPNSVDLCSLSNSTNTAMTKQQCILTMNRIPLSNNTNDSSSNALYATPNHVVSGININMSFTNPQQVGQWLTIKLCRLDLPNPSEPALNALETYELFNKQTVTDSRYFQTIYQHSFFMEPNTSLNRGS